MDRTRHAKHRDVYEGNVRSESEDSGPILEAEP